MKLAQEVLFLDLKVRPFVSHQIFYLSDNPLNIEVKLRDICNF